MISLRLPQELEQQLNFLSMAIGIPKNTILVQALAQHMKSLDLSTIPLEEGVTEQNPSIFRMEEKAKQYERVHQIADWAQRNAIWTKDASKTLSGTPTPGSYGRNVVVGYTETDDEQIAVISRNISQQAYGTASYYLTVTSLDNWLEYMIEVHPKP